MSGRQVLVSSRCLLAQARAVVLSRWTLALTAAILLLAPLRTAEMAPSPVGDGPGSWVQTLSTTRNQVVLEVQIPTITMHEVQEEGVTFQRLMMPNAGHTTEVGRPELPTFGRYVAVPIGAEVHVELLEAKGTTQTGVLVYPAQEPLPDCARLQQSVAVDEGDGDLPVPEEPPPFAFDQGFYQQNALYPSQPVMIEHVGRLRDVTYALVRFYPAQYNPAQQELTLYHSLRVRLSFRGGEDHFTDGRYRSGNFERVYRRLLLNYDVLESSPPRPDAAIQATEGEYLIITAPDFANPAQDLAEWKTRRGIQTVVVTTDETGTSLTEIDNYIQNAYDTWNPRPAYVLLLGDTPFIPTHYVTNHPYHGQRTGTDLYYFTTSGSDYMPDIAGSRIPASTEEEADRVVQNILDYEQNPPADSSYYDRFQVAAYFQDDDNNGTADRLFTQTSEEIHDFLEDTKGKTATRCYTTYSTDPQRYYYGDPVPAEVRTALLQHSDHTCINNDMADGRFILNHRDHGSDYGWGEPAYSIHNIRDLSFASAGELPVVFSINCMTGWFDSETDEEGCLGDSNGSCASSSFAEEFLIKERAIAVFAATRVSYSWHNDDLVLGYYDGIWSDMLGFGGGSPFEDDLYRLGDAHGWGKAYYMSQYSHSSTRITTMEIHHLLGDTTLEMWTDVPQNMTVSHNSTAPVGATSFDVNVNVAGATITIVQDGIIIGKVNSSVVGVNTVPLSPATIMGPFYVTVTKHNYRPYQGTVNVGATHTVSGCVYDGGSGVEGVWINFQSWTEPSAEIPPDRTDASGCYSRKVPDGEYSVTAEGERWMIHEDSQQVNIEGSDVANLDFQATSYRVWAPYTEGFETGRLGPAWAAGGDAYGRADILDCPHGGGSALILDSTDYLQYARAWAILSVDLSCRTDATLTFWWRENADESHSDDGVYIRRNASDSWCKILNLTNNNGTYEQEVINLNNAANSCWSSTALTSEFQIKFQQYDNYRWTGNDGIAIDDISITASGGTYTWHGSTNPDWDEPSNWDTGCVPGPQDDVIVPSGVPNWPNVNGLAYASNLTIQDGAHVDASSNGTLHIQGDWNEQGSGCFYATAGTVVFRGSGAQATVPNASSHYHHLKIGDGSTTSSLTPGSGLDVNGNLWIMPGAVLSGGSFTHNIAGHWSASGTFSTGTSTVIFDNSSSKTAAGATTSQFNNLTVEGGGTLRLNSDAAVQGDLLVAANGLLDINTRSLAVGGSVTNNGGLRQTRDTPNTMTTSFLTIPTGKYYGVDIYPTSGDMGATTVTVYGNQTCLNGGTSAVNRCYEIDPGTDQTADITYYYRDAEENGQDAAEIWHWNGASWNQETCIGRDPSGVEDNWIRAGGVDEYSPFLLSNSNPTAVELVRFEATPSGNNIQIEWETASEIDNLGFNLYRAESAPGGTRICLNADLIPSEAPGSPTGAVYTWVDESIALDTTYYYWLEDVDIYGETTLHGPASATAAESPVHRIYLPLVVR